VDGYAVHAFNRAWGSVERGSHDHHRQKLLLISQCRIGTGSQLSHKIRYRTRIFLAIYM
jgi:hypothetical protein